MLDAYSRGIKAICAALWGMVRVSATTAFRHASIPAALPDAPARQDPLGGGALGVQWARLPRAVDKCA